MRIDAYNTIYPVRNNNKLVKAKKSGANQDNVTDKFEISQAGKDYQIAKQAVLNTPEVRTDRVNDIKSKLDAGTYDVSDDDLVDKLLSKYFDE